MPKSFANYIHVDTHGEAQLGRLRVMHPTPNTPLIEWSFWSPFINGGVETREDDTFRNDLGTVEGTIPVAPYVDNGRFVPFYDPAFPPDGFGFTIGQFARDLGGLGHGPGFLGNVFTFFILGNGNPFGA